MEIFFGLIGIAVYFIPSFLGSDRKEAVWIFLFNLLLGWTVICWVIAIVWALTADKDTPTVIHTHTTITQDKSAADELTKLAALKEKGILTEDEYNKEKNKILDN